MTDRPEQPTVVELTAKRWKLLQLVSHVLFWPGIVIYIFTAGDDNGAAAALSAAATAAGLVLFFYAKFMAWWRHG